MAVAGKENCKRALEKLGPVAKYEEEALKSVMEFESMSQGGCELLVFYFPVRHDTLRDSKRPRIAGFAILVHFRPSLRHPLGMNKDHYIFIPRFSCRSQSPLVQPSD
jgi:hypothetical protein